MPEGPYLDKGSKRRTRRIRWKRAEVVSAILLTLAALGLSIAVAMWLITHTFD